jgi:hypothetical protein
VPDTLYETDFLRWSERQAAALDSLRRGKPPNDIDWPNLIEEVADLGRSQVNAVQSLLARALEHLLKAAAWPTSRDVPHWRGEALAFLRDARRRFTPSMTQRLDLQDLYADARAVVLAQRIEGAAPSGLPAECPLTLTALLPSEPSTLPDIDDILARLAGG